MSTYKTIAQAIQEIENWLRLATFLHEPLRLALLRILHNTSKNPTYNGLPDNPQQLFQELSTKHYNQIQKLIKKGIIQKDQVDLLFPPNSNATDSTKLDVTLICLLIRNCTNLPAPLNGWGDKNPPAHDLSIAAWVIRAREWRNYVHHEDPKSITVAILNTKWTEGVNIIKNLGYLYDTTKLRNVSLDPKHEVVLNSLFTYMARVELKQDTNDQLIEALRQQLQCVTKEVNFLKSSRKPISGIVFYDLHISHNSNTPHYYKETLILYWSNFFRSLIDYQANLLYLIFQKLLDGRNQILKINL